MVPGRLGPLATRFFLPTYRQVQTRRRAADTSSMAQEAFATPAPDVPFALAGDDASAAQSKAPVKTTQRMTFPPG